MKEKTYKIDRKLLKKAKERGFCLCDAKKKDDNSNVCPCEEFINSGFCKCLVFKQGE